MAKKKAKDKPPVRYEVGDLVRCMFHTLLFDGTILAISDGSERGFPGPLTYDVAIEGQGTVKLYQWEIIRKLDPKTAFMDVAAEIARRHVNAKVVQIIMDKVSQAKTAFRGKL